MLARLLLILAGLVLLWLWLRPRRPQAPPPPAPGAQSMRRCAECGLHLPESEALPGRGGYFCSHAHRQAFESRRPPA